MTVIQHVSLHVCSLHLAIVYSTVCLVLVLCLCYTCVYLISCLQNNICSIDTHVVRISDIQVH